MPQLNVYDNTRVHLLGFERATTGEPDSSKPDLDDRSVTGTDHGPIVGVVAGDTITVHLRRNHLPGSAELHAVSSDPRVFTVTKPVPPAALPSSDVMSVTILGGIGGNPATAKLEIHYGSPTGVILHELSVWCFTLLTVEIQPHNVSIGTSGAPPVGSAASIRSIIDLVKATWRPCGIDFVVDTTQNDSYPAFAAVGTISSWGEFNQVFANRTNGAINAYFVQQLAITGENTGVLGYGISRQYVNAHPGAFTNPGIILGDTNVGGTVRSDDALWLANDLAHEIGHFFGLWHYYDAGGGGATPRSDTWAYRMLMHNYNTRGAEGTWRDDIGYGYTRRGHLVTFKDLTQTPTDGECSTARTTVNGASGPY